MALNTIITDLKKSGVNSKLTVIKKLEKPTLELFLSKTNGMAMETALVMVMAMETALVMVMAMETALVMALAMELAMETAMVVALALAMALVMVILSALVMCRFCGCHSHQKN